MGQAHPEVRREEGNMPLYRSRKYRMIAGVCGGLAEWLGWSPTMTRVLYVIVSIFSAGFPGTIAYVIMWIVVPQAPER